jgi:hypothetical protein
MCVPKSSPESVRREIRGVGQKLWEQVIESMAQQLMELAWNSSPRNVKEIYRELALKACNCATERSGVPERGAIFTSNESAMQPARSHFAPPLTNMPTLNPAIPTGTLKA